MIYAGIGSRETPSDVMVTMSKLAKYFAHLGWILRSGGANGADSAFEAGCDEESGGKEIYLPWKGFNGKVSLLNWISPEALEMAALYHPAWNKLNDAARRLMARNCYQVMGGNLDCPSDFIVCWTKDGKASGGTGQAVRIAIDYGIPVFNLYNTADRLLLKEFVNKSKGA